MPREANLQRWRQGGSILRRSDVAPRGAEGKAVRAEWKGVQELKKQIKQLNDHLEGTGNQWRLIRSIDAVFEKPTLMMRDTIADRTRSSRWPGSVTAAIFAVTDMSKSPRGKKRTSLVGVPTGSPRGRYPSVRSASNPKGIFVEWGKRSGKKVGMSLARIFESGTRKFPARPAVRPAIQQAGPAVLRELGEGFRGVLRDFEQVKE